MIVECHSSDGIGMVRGMMIIMPTLKIKSTYKASLREVFSQIEF